jgi:Mn2+/Fe2+ NRAMP family transporter
VPETEARITTPILKPEDVRQPPSGFWSTLRKLGPGLIISGSIVGSGELIATTTLGASVGFAALWLIIVSCLIKVVVQEELGRYCIASGETTFQALDRVPGPRLRVSWVLWCWMLMFVATTFQHGGIIGGAAQVFNVVFPQIDVRVWILFVAALAIGLLLRGRYRHIERTSTWLVSSFTLITVVCALSLFWTPHAPSIGDLADGFRFELPVGGLAVAFAAFGITGVGATELVFYPYWCLEKGYARFVGPREESEAWLARAKGWTRVMQIDVVSAMAVYTLATVAFYILGASVLHGQQQIPGGYDMVRTLSGMYTATLGDWAFYVFLLGAFIVLFSTTFSSTASSSRVVVDFLALIRLINPGSYQDRLVWWRRAVVVIVGLYAFWYLLLGVPVVMVVIGGIAQACMLPVLGFSTIYLRYKHTDPSNRPGWILDMLLWLTSTLMLGFAVYTLIRRLLD